MRIIVWGVLYRCTLPSTMPEIWCLFKGGFALRCVYAAWHTQDCKPLMLKSGDRKVLDPTDVFEINPDFKSKTYRVRLPPGMSSSKPCLTFSVNPPCAHCYRDLAFSMQIWESVPSEQNLASSMHEGRRVFSTRVLLSDCMVGTLAASCARVLRFGACCVIVLGSEAHPVLAVQRS